MGDNGQRSVVNRLTKGPAGESTGANRRSTDAGDTLAPKYSCYPNGATRPRAQHVCDTFETRGLSNGDVGRSTQMGDEEDCRSSTTELNDNLSLRHDKQRGTDKGSVTAEKKRDISGGEAKWTCDVDENDDKLTTNGRTTEAVNDSADDSSQPLDFSMSGLAKTGVAAASAKKPPDTKSASDVPKSHAKHDSKSQDSYRPVGRLVHDLGLELVREQVYRDLIDIQTVKAANNRLEEREKSQLSKLIEAQDRLALRNAPYQLPTKRCRRCRFLSPSANVMTLHLEFGTESRVDSSMHVCCLCNGHPGFRTRSSTQFLQHLTNDHSVTGRLLKKKSPYACRNCPFEHRSSVRLVTHIDKCAKKFSLATNLQPLLGDCDIPLIYRPSDRKRPVTVASPNVQSNGGAAASYGAVGCTSVRTLLSTLRQQVSQPFSRPPAMPSLICEICGKLVDGREALWDHFRLAHHVELCRVTMREKEPWMKCDVCSGRFWTYQGLSRHLLLAHNRALAGSSGYTGGAVPLTVVPPVVSRCHLCGGSQTSNPLSHFSAYHNVTLLEMYHAKLCCLCNRKVSSGRAFEEHMVQHHSDIFANYDVLRTVLQALTAARYFKSDDTREPTTQHIMQLSARASSAEDTSTSKKSGHHHHRHRSQPATNAASSTADVSASGTAQQNLPLKHGASKSVSPQKRRLSGVSVGRGRGSPGVRRRHMSVRSLETQLSAAGVKANDRQPRATAEEVKKLYEDLADLGRPILRSMRHRQKSVDTDATKCAAKDDSSVPMQDQSVTSEQQSLPSAETVALGNNVTNEISSVN